LNDTEFIKVPTSLAHRLQPNDIWKMHSVMHQEYYVLRAKGGHWDAPYTEQAEKMLKECGMDAASRTAHTQFISFLPGILFKGGNYSTKHIIPSG